MTGRCPARNRSSIISGKFLTSSGVVLVDVAKAYAVDTRHSSFLGVMMDYSFHALDQV